MDKKKIKPPTSNPMQNTSASTLNNKAILDHLLGQISGQLFKDSSLRNYFSKICIQLKIVKYLLVASY